MIIAFLGTVGSGKTLSAVREAFQYYKMGHTVYANMGLSFPHVKLDKKTFDTLIENKEGLQDAVILIDEMHIWLDSRSSMKKKNRLLTYFILQTRKRNVRMLVTTQHMDQIDKRLRNTLDIIVYCKNVSNKTSLVTNARTIIKQEFWQPYASDPNKPPQQRLILANPWFDKYDTKEMVDFDEE